MTKVYELPNGHRMVADIDESTRVCNITETTLDSLVSKLNYYSEQTGVFAGRWIPVSERLPENSGNYLITYCLRDKIETQEAVYAKDEEDKWFDITDIEITLAVIAWMPLPEPYKAERNDKE